MFEEALQRYGAFTENIQIKAAIALSQIEMNGIFVDSAQAASVRSKMVAQLQEAVGKLRAHEEYRNIFKLKDESADQVSGELAMEEENLYRPRSLRLSTSISSHSLPAFIKISSWPSFKRFQKRSRSSTG